MKDGIEVKPFWSKQDLSPNVDFVIRDWIVFMTNKGVVRTVGTNFKDGKNVIVTTPIVSYDPTTRVLMTVHGSKYGLHGEPDEYGTAIEAWHQWCVMEFVPFYGTEAVQPELQPASQTFTFSGGEACIDSDS